LPSQHLGWQPYPQNDQTNEVMATKRKGKLMGLAPHPGKEVLVGGGGQSQMLQHKRQADENPNPQVGMSFILTAPRQPWPQQELVNIPYCDYNLTRARV